MIRLIVVDDHQGITEGLVALLSDSSDILVVGTAHDLADARALIERLSPDVILCDVQIRTPDDGLELLAEYPLGPLFIMLSAHLNPHFVMTAIRHGARGYLSKMASIDEIAAAVRTVAQGGDVFPDDARHAIRTSLPPPSARELAILELLAQGGTYSDIAASLSLSARTVESHLRRQFIRYGVANRVALVRLAQRQGWITAGL